ncbi:MAG: hypothetical protein FJ110_00685 [Deltaproteobacteria bacterium]|nr:hypothetical protein [Deltaproteobacteria bacterium]
MKRLLLLSIWVWMLGIVWDITPLHGQGIIHGADSVFEKEGITILWAVLKGKTEESTWVVIKVIRSEEKPSPFQLFSVEAEDPFSKAKEWVVKGVKLEKENLIRSQRSSFIDKTSRRIIFYRNQEDFLKENPIMVVFYLGVPDTSPELLSEKEMEGYFEKALQRLKK